jgi:NO-binding membrane sensor protein with MHYT domain
MYRMLFPVGTVLISQYSVWLVALSCFISFCGCYLALLCARHMFRRDGNVDRPIAIGAAVALGGFGIWSMHFIGMYGYKLRLPVEYDVVLTLLSLVAVVVIAGFALFLAGGRGKFSQRGWLLGSAIAGIGVCIMHYMGVYAMTLNAAPNFDVSLVGLSIVIAISAATAALWLAFHVVFWWHQFLAAVAMTIAVCAMHYTGMAAVEFICTAPRTGIFSGAPTISGDGIVLVVMGLFGAALTYIVWHLIDRAFQPTSRTLAK